MTSAMSLRQAFGRFPTGVTVITALTSDGTPVGFTANSFTSVSIDPPMLLICPGKFLSSFDIFHRCSHFGVSILAEGQENVSNIFASSSEDRFVQVPHQNDMHNIPLINGAAAHFSCSAVDAIEAGDHVILLGKIEDFKTYERRGLGYADGKYFSLGLEREAATAPVTGTTAIAGAIIECDGHVLMEETSKGLCPIQIELKDRSQVRQVLLRYLEKLGLTATLGSAYSVFDDRQSGHYFTYFNASVPARPDIPSAAWVRVQDLASQTFVSNAHAVMMNRFATEFKTQDFRLYVGDEDAGETHKIDKEA